MEIILVLLFLFFKLSSEKGAEINAKKYADEKSRISDIIKKKGNGKFLF